VETAAIDPENSRPHFFRWMNITWNDDKIDAAQNGSSSIQLDDKIKPLQARLSS
jgi:hypothetical protein